MVGAASGRYRRCASDESRWFQQEIFAGRDPGRQGFSALTAGLSSRCEPVGAIGPAGVGSVPVQNAHTAPEPRRIVEHIGSALTEAEYAASQPRPWRLSCLSSGSPDLNEPKRIERAVHDRAARLVQVPRFVLARGSALRCQVRVPATQGAPRRCGAHTTQ